MPKKVSNIALSFLSSLMLSTSLYAVRVGELMNNSEDEEKHYIPIRRIAGNATVIDLGTLNATQGFVIQGVSPNDQSSTSVSNAGDINADGINDVIVGNYATGATYVVYGRKGGYPGPINLATLNATQGFVIHGAEPQDSAGFSVSYARDMNGDGLNDVIVGAPHTNIQVGASYVIYSQKGGYPDPINLATLNATQGFVMQGSVTYDNIGYSVSYAGDMNGDRIDDVIVGNYAAGATYVVYGRKGGYPGPIRLATLNVTQGFIMQGLEKAYHAGSSVSYAGDMNSDGLNDVILGAWGIGTSYVIYGRKGGYTNPINLSTLNATQGFVMQGVADPDVSGWSVSFAGDINADGIDDVIVGAPYAAPYGKFQAGSSYVIYGRKGGYTNPINLSTLNALQGFVIHGAEPRDWAGTSVSYAGDMNADGIDDIIVGAPGIFFPNNAGKSYVIYGRKGGYTSCINLANLTANQGLIIQGATSWDFSGRAVSYAGDMNADGIDDVIVGAPGASASYVIYGNKNFTDFEPLPRTINQEIKNKPHKSKNSLQEKKTSKSIRAEKKAKVRIMEDQGSIPILSRLAKVGSPASFLPDATSDGISSHQIPWYSPARLWRTLKGFLSQNSRQVLDLTNRHVRNLVDLRGRCENLKNTAEENYDKWYGYSLEDLAESVTESLNDPETISEETVIAFEKRLRGIKRDFRPGNAQQPKLTFITELESSSSLIPHERSFELLSISSTPLLGSGTAPLALGY